MRNILIAVALLSAACSTTQSGRSFEKSFEQLACMRVFQVEGDDPLCMSTSDGTQD
jgi:hypothetical protein